MTTDTSVACFWTLITTIALLIGAFALTSAIVDGEGRKSNNHVGPIPESVVRLADDSYILRGHDQAPNDICKGSGDNGGDPVKNTTILPHLEDALYVRCNADQTWNDRRALSINYAHAMVRVGTSPIFITAGALWLLVWNVPLWVVPWRRDVKETRRKAALKKVDTETKRRELATAYAKGDIDEIEFENALDRLLRSAP